MDMVCTVPVQIFSGLASAERSQHPGFLDLLWIFLSKFRGKLASTVARASHLTKDEVEQEKFISFAMQEK